MSFGSRIQGEGKWSFSRIKIGTPFFQLKHGFLRDILEVM